MENKFLCLMAGYDDDTENYLAGIQKKLYAVGLTGQHTKHIPPAHYPADLSSGAGGGSGADGEENCCGNGIF